MEGRGRSTRGATRTIASSAPAWARPSTRPPGSTPTSSADRATWASFQNRQNLVLLVAGDPALFNPYGSILVNPAKGPHIKAAEARIWHEWLTSGRGRAAIAGFKVQGEQLFFPSAAAPRS